MQILVVCLGNICRSPLAKVILQNQFLQNNVSYTVDSCGTSDHHIGSSADQRSIEVARKYGLNLDDHIVKKFSAQFFSQFDWIFAMDQNNQKTLLAIDSLHQFTSKIRLFREFDLQSSSNHPSTLEVADPYHGEEHDFETMYQTLVRCSIGFCDYLEKQVTKS